MPPSIVIALDWGLPKNSGIDLFVDSPGFARFSRHTQRSAGPRVDSYKETAMRYVSYVVAIATLAGAVAGCADPYYPRSGYSQAYSPVRLQLSGDLQLSGELLLAGFGE